MANILLTERCVRSCPYCFAKKHMNESDDEAFLSWEDLIYIADLFDFEHIKHISLLGGEPTLHPDYVNFVLYLAARNFHSTTFTSGIMSQKRLNEAVESFADIDKARYSFVCNLNHPEMSSPKESLQIEKFLTEFGAQVTLSFNIFHLDFEMDYLFDYIERFNLNRHIRMGLAHPIPGVNNAIIRREDFKIMAERIVSYVPMFIKYNVSAGFDCGYPMCIFTDDQLGKMLRIEREGDRRSLRFVCNPAIDIGPDMMVWSCFPLSGVNKRSIYEFDSISEIIQYYKELHLETRSKQAGIFKECEYCRYRDSRQCSGGCLAHILNDLQDEKKVMESI